MDTPDSTPSLSRFLCDHGMSALETNLAADTLENLVHELFTVGRPSLLRMLAARGLNLSDRQAIANALGKASRTGYPGVCETTQELANRTAWLDGHGQPTVDTWQSGGSPFLVFTSAGDAAPTMPRGDHSNEM